MSKEEIFEALVEETMDFLSSKKKKADLGPRVKDHRLVASESTIRKFVSPRLIIMDGKVRFKGEYKYMPEYWLVDTPEQRKKVVSYIGFANMTL